MNAFSLLTAALCLITLCVVLCIAHISYDIEQSHSSIRLLDAKFPSGSDKLTGKTVAKNEDIYNRPTSDARLAMRLFYTTDDLEELSRQASPNKLPKGRNKI